MSFQMIRKSVLAAVAAGGLLAGGIWAGRIVADPMAEHGRFSAAQIFNRIADRLDLSSSQRSQVKQVLKSHQSEILRQLQAQTDARKALHAAVLANSIGEGAIRQKAEELGRIHGDGALLLAQIRSEVLAVLNDEQKTRLETLHQHLSHKGDRMIASIRDFLSSPD